MLTAAVWALRKPDRRVAVVAALDLWRRAVDAMGGDGRRKSRRLTLSWLLLFCGAAAVVCATTLPSYHTTMLCRRLAVAVYPTAEIAAPDAMADMRNAAAALLDRLAPSDKVRLVTAPEAGGQSHWLSPSDVLRRIERLSPLAMSAARIDPPGPGADVQHTYYFVAAGAHVSAGPSTSVVEIDTRLKQLTLDAVGAEQFSDGAVEAFVALRNTSSKPWTGMISLKGCDRTGADVWRSAGRIETIAPGERGRFVLRGRSSPLLVVIAAEASKRDDQADASAYLARRQFTPQRVAIVGSREQLLRRYVRADEMLELVDDAADADMVIANLADGPLGVPCLAIDPPNPPDGWRRGAELRSVVLDRADLSADHPVMSNVDLAAVAVRRMKPWRAGGAFVASPARAESVASYDGQALVLVGPQGAGAPRRVYLAFDVDQANTNFAMRDAFVTFMANTMRYLAPPGPTRTVYEFATGRDAGPPGRWKNVLTPQGDSRGALLWPGGYVDSGGRTRAINLVGLHEAKAAVTPTAAVEAAALPQPAYADTGMRLWPMFLTAAILLWLAGWAVRLR